MNEKLFCIECKKYFKDKKEWDNEHNKVFDKVKNVKHNYLIEGNVLSYIFDLMSKNYENDQIINKQNIEISRIINKINFYEDSLKNDIFFETNINLKNIENKIDGKCLIHFFPKSVNFKIECNGDINFNGKKEFEIEILFPFKTAELKFCSIEKLQGCLSSKSVQNSSEEDIIENLKKNKIDVSLNGTLTFSNYGFSVNEPLVLYNITQKNFLAYENYKWKFINNCFSSDGKIKNECIIYLELNFESKELYIKNKYNYLGNNGNFVAKEKNDAKYLFQFLNSFYGIITIVSNKKYLNSKINDGSIELSDKASFFMIINI